MRTPVAHVGMGILAGLAFAVGCSGPARAAHPDLPDPAFATQPANGGRASA
ncbi:MAG: hypothetical protein GX590_06470 [Lentisphaerae bacterium]|nr:hypothetical protein [Lentisphaerota bacterium]